MVAFSTRTTRNAQSFITHPNSRHSSLIVNIVLICSIAIMLMLASYVVHAETTVDDLVDYLPGYGPIKGKNVFAGYVDVKHEESEGSLFYWFVGQADGDTSAPVVVWSNGGPGSSALIGFFAELGPFRIQPDLTLITNPYSWTRVANMLFIDHPIGTGMSYASNDASFSKNQDHVSAHLYTVLQHFYNKHPEYKKNELFLSGESYAGKYMPTLAERIIKLKHQGDNDINLQGIALGDAFVAPMIQRLIKGEQAYWNGLMGQTQLEQLKAIQSKCIRHIQDGYTNQIHSDCEDLKSYMLLAAGIVNVYDVRKFVPSTNKTLIDMYMNQKEVREALHVPAAKLKYSTNAKSDVYVNLKYDILKSVKHLIPFLAQHVRILLYNGNFDLQDGPVGTEQYLFSLGIPGMSRAPRNLWFLKEKIAGYEWTSSNITFLTVHGAGHFVPTDRPASGVEMIRRFLYNEKFCKKDETVPLSFTTLTPDEFREYLDVDEKGEHRVPCAITDVLCKKLMKNCNGNGHCEQGICVCNEGFTGEDCSIRMYSSLKANEKVSLDKLLQQEWVYYKLDKLDQADLMLVELHSQNVSVRPVLNEENIKSDPYFVGEGFGGNQPFGGVCVYIKSGDMPTWHSFDTVHCFREDTSAPSFISPIPKAHQNNEPYYIGIFNAQPYQVKFDLQYGLMGLNEFAKRMTLTQGQQQKHDEL